MTKVVLSATECAADSEAGTYDALARVRVIIPTLNASSHLDALLDGLSRQGIDPPQVTVIDSESDDDTVARFREFGAGAMSIARSEFDHGGARQRAIDAAAEPFVVLLTQDAVPLPGAIARILGAFDDERVAMAYGRQLPRPAAGPVERFARLESYPEESETRALPAAYERGIRAAFCSNSFSAWRVEALRSVGGFPTPIHFGEDQVAAARLLKAGFAVRYEASAEVVHSHAYGIGEEFRRYFDVGALHARYASLFDSFGAAESEGIRFVLRLSRYLLGEAPTALPSAWLAIIAKYAGYRLGRQERRLSARQKARLSSQPYIWHRF